MGHPQTVDIPHNCGELSSYIALVWNHFWRSIFMHLVIFFNMWKNKNSEISCTEVHEFEEKLKFHVHGFEEITKYHVPRYIDLKKKQNSMYNLTFFFHHVKKLLNFWNFVNIKVANSKLNHLGFYCKLYFFDRTIRKIRKWNWN